MDIRHSLFLVACLDTSLFGRAASVVWYWCHVSYGLDAKSVGTQRPNCCLSATTWASDINIYCFEAKSGGFLGAIFGGKLRCERRSLAASFEIDMSRTGPAEHIALLVANGYDRVVERRMDVCLTMRDLTLVLDLSSCCRFLCHVLLRDLLLAGDCLWLTFAGSRITSSSLTTCRKTSSMAQSAIRTRFHQSSNV